MQYQIISRNRDSSNLTNHIKNLMAKEGPITFARYMDLCLYHRDFGFYEQGGAVFGQAGHYFTASDLHSIYGGIWARKIARVWECLSRGEITFLEYGPGTGRLARDIYGYLSELFLPVWEKTRFVFLEKSLSLRRKQQYLLGRLNTGREKMNWVESPSKMDSIEGVVLAHEVLDAFPVHRVTMKRGILRELYVDNGPAGFIWRKGPLSLEASLYLARYPVRLLEGQVADINPGALAWLQEVAGHLKKGFVYIVDYGYEHQEPGMASTLQCYYRHGLSCDPLVNPGGQDITAQVNWGVLEAEGRKLGFTVASRETLQKFILREGLKDILPPRQADGFDRELYRAALAVKRLLLDEGMGRVFTVLTLKK